MSDPNGGPYINDAARAPTGKLWAGDGGASGVRCGEVTPAEKAIALILRAWCDWPGGHGAESQAHVDALKTIGDLLGSIGLARHDEVTLNGADILDRLSADEASRTAEPRPAQRAPSLTDWQRWACPSGHGFIVARNDGSEAWTVHRDDGICVHSGMLEDELLAHFAWIGARSEPCPDDPTVDP